jgi:hypothetical protein
MGLFDDPSHHAPIETTSELLRHRADMFVRDCEVLSLRAFVAALQRLDGADALPT